MNNRWFETNEGGVRMERAIAPGGDRRTPCSTGIPSREMQAVPARRRTAPPLKAPSSAVLCGCGDGITDPLRWCQTEPCSSWHSESERKRENWEEVVLNFSMWHMVTVPELLSKWFLIVEHLI